MTTDRFDFAVGWDWEYDAGFVALLESAARARRLSFLSISHHNVGDTLRRLQKGSLSIGAFLDRASDSDEQFVPLVRHLRKTPTIHLNHPDALHHATDKATMHLEFITRGINVPFTIIISPYNKKRDVELSLGDLSRLGRPFIIKPANTTGGGVGVILGAETLKDVIESRQHHRNDKYLLQEKVLPLQFRGRKAWFRVFYVCGTVIPTWWDDETHVYGTVTETDLTESGLAPLTSITRSIQEVCGLDFFSSEIAVTADTKFVAVDYVNDICDMRLQSQHIDGVPDRVVHEVCRHIIGHIKGLVGGEGGQKA